ncbi:FG-GAP-like repeat-containing protein [Hymenobacter ruricola]|uniref:VCBS repeat-containing protein n=1 Tax=Hymenobacter ruricola TaxID=2791023 RepID=A0ABS0I3H1_9BACT|nr:FG-GAP-like repeat-containing protein [Hymenobacter ruricola]MBF9221346.1 VCBS repeat-containing protein [Hymenobacter ruricola]
MLALTGVLAAVRQEARAESTHPAKGLSAAPRSITHTQSAVTYSLQGDRGVPTLAFGSRHLFLDLDNDGDQDVLYQTGNSTGAGIAVQLNSGGAFGAAIAQPSGAAFTGGPLAGVYFTQVAPPQTQAVDLDNDGDPDIVEFLNGTAPRVILNNGNGTFTAAGTTGLPTLAFGSRQLFVDLDNDGDPDLLYQTSNSSGQGFNVQLNNGNGTFAAAIAANGSGTFGSGPLNGITFTQLTQPSLTAADLDDDGDPDLVDYQNNTAPRLVRNNGNGTFTALALGSLPTLAFGARYLLFDVESDGDQDILYQTGNTTATGIRLQLNNGDGTFAAAIAATDGTGAFSSGPLSGMAFSQISAPALDAVDYDRDGDQDLFDFVNGAAPRSLRQDGTRPQLSSTAPADNATGVSPATNLVLTFDRSVSKGNGNLYLVRVSDNAVVETTPIGSAAVTGAGTTWTYNPVITLASNTAYALRSDEETFIDADGRTFYGIFDNTTYNFTTGAPAVAPTVTTDVPASITGAGAVLGGNVAADGGAAVSERGVVYVPGSGTPTTANTKVAIGAGTGSYSTTVTGLASGTLYSVRAYATNSAGTSYGGVQTFTTLTTIVSSVRTGASPTNAGSVSFAVTFASNVSGLTTGNFSVAASGVSGASVASVSGSGNAYTVVVNTGTGSGTVQLQLSNSTGITPGVSNVPFTTGDSYTIDKAAPTAVITSSAGASGGNTNASPFTVTVTFSESVTGFAAGDVTVTNGALSGFGGSGTTYSFTLTPAANGLVTVSVPASSAQDAAGNGNVAAPSYSITYAAPVTATVWTGSASTDWFAAANWTAGVPTAALDATVPAAAPRMPLLTNGPATTKNLTIASAATLAQSGGTLDVRGNWTNNGAFTATGGTVELGATATASIAGSSATRFWNLTTQQNGADLNTSAGLTIQRLLTTVGNLNLNGNPTTLLSDATGTALVYNNPGRVVGATAVVQRYLSPDLNPGPGYRHLASPIANAAQVGGLATTGFTPIVNPAYNTAAAPNLVTPFPNVYGYDQTRLASVANGLSAFDKGWYSPTNPTDVLPSGKGFTVNISAGLAVSFAGGPLHTGTLSSTLTRNASASANAADAGWHLVGNPYPSPFDYSLVAPADRAGLDAAIYVFASTSQYAGSYRAYVNGVGGDPILALGQGFFVRVNAGQTAATLTFRDAARVTSYQNPVFHRGSSTRPLVQLDLQGGGLSDPLYVYFEPGATAGTDAGFDAVKLPNSHGLNLTAVAGNDELAIAGLPALGATPVTVPLTVRVPTAGTYVLNAAQLANLPAGVTAYLRDRQTGALVDLSAQPSYAFQLSATTSGRFELLVMAQRALATAPSDGAAQVAVFPNPAEAKVFLELPASLNGAAVQAELLDAVGRVVRAQELPGSSAPRTFSLAEVAAGVYSLRVTTPVGVVVKKLVVE